MDDAYQLKRFVDAQNMATYERAVSELRAGEKVGHWMWFIFPQIAGLGFSPMSQRFAIFGRAEAEGYLQHPVLGPRLAECTQLVNGHAGRDIADVLGNIDAVKFRSSMTLFARTASDNGIFLEALEIFFRGQMDELTLEKL